MILGCVLNGLLEVSCNVVFILWFGLSYKNHFLVCVLLYINFCKHCIMKKTFKSEHVVTYELDYDFYIE